MEKLEEKVKGRRGKYREKFRVGDSITIFYESKLGYWRVRKFSGLIIGKKENKYNSYYTVRNVVKNVGVEFKFFLYSSEVIKIEKAGERKIVNVKKNKLYYLRKKRLNLSKV